MSERSTDDIRADRESLRWFTPGLSSEKLGSVTHRLLNDIGPLLDQLLVVEGELAEANRKLTELAEMHYADPGRLTSRDYCGNCGAIWPCETVEILLSSVGRAADNTPEEQHERM